MVKTRARCAACGRAFRPDPYNVDHQKCCVRPTCVHERKSRRQREWYARKCRDDPAFREKGKRRCAAANRKRRAGERAAAATLATILPGTVPQALYETLCGVVSQLTDTTDPVLLSASIRSYQERGRRVALDTAVGGPGG